MIHPGYRRSRRVLLLALALAGLAGCSGRPSVQGTVTIDGAPLNGGVIVFTPVVAGEGTNATGGPITDGKYLLSGPKGPEPGSYRVEVSWKKKTGRQVPVPGDPKMQMDETAEAIPPTYRGPKSTLAAEIKPGSNTYNFDLKSH
jgi:hypothetical protein